MACPALLLMVNTGLVSGGDATSQIYEIKAKLKQGIRETTYAKLALSVETAVEE